MTEARDVTQLCFSSNLAGIVANKIEQSFYCLFLFRNRVNRTRPNFILQVLGFLFFFFFFFFGGGGGVGREMPACGLELGHIEIWRVGTISQSNPFTLSLVYIKRHKASSGIRYWTIFKTSLISQQ